MTSNLKKRIIIGFIGAPLLIWIILLGDLYFLGLMLIIVLFSVHELNLMQRAKSVTPLGWLVLIFSALILLNFYYKFTEYWLAVLIPIISFNGLELFRRQKSPIFNISTALLSTFYIPLSFGSLVLLRQMDETGYFVITVLLCVWASDTFAYFGGRWLGQKIIEKKFFERISPKKTWEGVIFGLLGSIGIGYLLNQFLLENQFSTVEALMLGSMIGFLSPAGDLIESMYKRDSQHKDSSEFIPGHGGFFDRFDSLCFVSPFVYLYYQNVLI